MCLKLGSLNVAQRARPRCVIRSGSRENSAHGDQTLAYSNAVLARKDTVMCIKAIVFLLVNAFPYTHARLEKKGLLLHLSKCACVCVCVLWNFTESTRVQTSGAHGDMCCDGRVETEGKSRRSGSLRSLKSF